MEKDRIYKLEVKKIITYLEDKWKGRKCPMCNSNHWVISDIIYELREFRGGNLNAGSPLYPVIPIICDNCGNTIFINALKAGALPTFPQGGKK